jgi:WD40 repeat protein
MLLLLEASAERAKRFQEVMRQLEPEMKVMVWQTAKDMIREIVPHHLSAAKLITLDVDLTSEADGPDSVNALDVAKFLVSQSIVRPVLIHSQKKATAQAAAEFERADWTYSSVPHIGTDWIEVAWRRFAKRMLGPEVARPRVIGTRTESRAAIRKFASYCVIGVLAVCSLVAIILYVDYATRKVPHSFDEMVPLVGEETKGWQGTWPELVAVYPPPTSDYIAAMAIGFSPDGSRLAVGYADGKLVVWNSYSASTIAKIESHHISPISHVLFAPDGRTLVDAAWDNTIKVYDLADEKLCLRATLSGHTDRIQGMSIATDGLTLATSSFDKTIRIWDLATDPPRERDKIETGQQVWAVSFSPNGRLLASGEDKNIVLRGIASPGSPLIESIPAHESGICRLSYAPDGKTLASAGMDKTLRLWEMSCGEPGDRMCLLNRGSVVESLAFSPDGNWLVSTDSMIVLWDVRKRSQRLRWYMSGPVKMAAFVPDGRHFAVSCNNERVYLFRVPR